MKIIEGKCQIKDCNSTKLVKGEFLTYCLSNHHQQLKEPKNRNNIEKIIQRALNNKGLDSK